MDRLTVRQVAALLGVTRSAVGNMRARDPSFPDPVATEGGTLLFDHDAIVRWGTDTGRTVHPDAIDRSPPPAGVDLGTAVRAALGVVRARHRGRLRAAEPIDAVRTLIDALHDGWTEQAEQAQVLPTLRTALKRWDASAEAAATDALADPHPADTVDATVAARSLTEAGRLTTSASSDRLTAWVVAAAGRIDGVVADPACGLGGFLVEAAHQASGRIGALVGADTVHDSLAATALRLLAHGRHATLLPADALQRETAVAGWLDRCDLVLTDPPAGRPPGGPVADPVFGRAPKGEQSFLWLGLVARMLREGGRGVVVAPLRTLDAGGPAAAFRARLLRAGRVLAVVTLPRGMRPGSAPELALWVLHRPTVDAPRDVLLVDGAALAAGSHDPVAGPNALRRIINPFARGDHDAEPWPNTVVVRPDQQGGEVLLTPWANGAVPSAEPGMDVSLALTDALELGDSPGREGVQQPRAGQRSALLQPRVLTPGQLADEMDALATRLTQVATEIRAHAGATEATEDGRTIEELVEAGELELLAGPRRRDASHSSLRLGDIIVTPGLDEPATIHIDDDGDPHSTWPGLGGVVLRPRPPDLDRSRAITVAINTHLAGRWPQSSRGPVSGRKVLALIRVPTDVDQARLVSDRVWLRREVRQLLVDLGHVGGPPSERV